MLSKLTTAVCGKHLVSFSYHGHRRVIEPHAVGVKNGKTQVLGYQVGGSSSSGDIPDWRRFDLSEMSNIDVLNETFPGPRPAPSGVHSPWDTLFIVVQ